MDETTDTSTGEDSGAHAYQPHDAAGGQTPERQPVDAERRFSTFLRTTIPSEHLDAAMADPTVIDDLQATVDDNADLVFNILATARDAQADGEEADFRILTDDLDMAEAGIEHDGMHVPNRYDIMETLGVGANGQVFGIFDNNLQRVVAAKFLHPKKAKASEAFAAFIREARVTASLSHPNILPIHDVAISDGGLPYFTMRKAQGLALADVISASVHQGRPLPEIESYYDRADIISKVCDAVAYAHSVGIVHQDIKPDNIVLGRFGEVVVIDWGTALTAEERMADEVRIQGTPAYMAPEQARREGADERSDIYAIGATLFHLLTLRLPLMLHTATAFWNAKRAGLFQEPTAAERAHVPAPLMAIALKAMHADPEQRYASIGDLRQDLRRFQAGLSIAAYRDHVGDIARRLYHRHQAVIWSVAAAMIVVAILAGVLIYEKSKQYSRWHTIYAQDFSANSQEQLEQHWNWVYLDRWKPDRRQELPWGDDAPWQVSDGQLHFQPPPTMTFGAHNLVYALPIPGNIRVDWDVTPLTRGLDLNCFIAGDDRSTGYTFHVAGYWNNRRIDCTRFTERPGQLLMDRSWLPTPVEIGRTYHLRMERINERIRLYVDDQLAIDAQDSAPLFGSRNQYFGFETSTTVMAIDNVVVQQQHLPERVEAIAVPDGLLAEGHYEEALTLYRGISQHFADRDMAIVADYRMARCLASLDRFQEARALLATWLVDHADHQLRHLARALLLECQLGLGLDTAAIDTFAEMTKDAETPKSIARTSVAMYFKFRGQALRQAGWSLETPDVSWALLDTWDRLCADFKIQLPTAPEVDQAIRLLMQAGYGRDLLERYPTSGSTLGFLLEQRYDFEGLLEHFPDNEQLTIHALLGLERYDEIIRRHPYTINWVTLPAYQALGRSEELLEHPSLSLGDRIHILVDLGRLDEVFALDPTNALALAVQGRYDEIDLAHQQTDSTYAERALLKRGQIAPLLQMDKRTQDKEEYLLASCLQAIRLLQAGDRDAGLTILQELDGRAKPLLLLEPIRLVLIPFLLATAEGRQAELLNQWHADNLDPRYEFSRMKLYLPVLLEGGDLQRDPDRMPQFGILLEGMHHELHDRPAEAIQAYRRFPLDDQDSWQPADALVRWRIAELSR